MHPVKEKIVADLKSIGYSTKQVSVKNHGGGYSSSLKITIRDPSVSYSKVEEIENRYTSISRDEVSGEILSGGNTYIDINLTDEVYEAWSAQYLPKVVAAIENLTGPDKGVSIDERFSIFRDGRYLFTVNDRYDSWLLVTYSRPDQIAVDLYKLKIKLKEVLPKEFVFNYWYDVLWRTTGLWRVEGQPRDIMAMAKDTAVHFNCATERGDSEKETSISEWTTEFLTLHPRFS